MAKSRQSRDNETSLKGIALVIMAIAFLYLVVYHFTAILIAGGVYLIIVLGVFVIAAIYLGAAGIGSLIGGILGGIASVLGKK